MDFVFPHTLLISKTHNIFITVPFTINTMWYLLVTLSTFWIAVVVIAEMLFLVGSCFLLNASSR